MDASSKMTCSPMLKLRFSAVKRQRGNRTRHSHRLLDGETRDVDDTFSNGCEYPGDPKGEPAEVYNCRCTLISQIEGFEIEQAKSSPQLAEQDYEEWKHEHEVKK